jgi:integrase/recombinase XerD
MTAMKTRAVSGQLFDDREIWNTDPMAAFDAFVLSPRFLELGRRPAKKRAAGEEGGPAPIRAGSVKVYRAMFGKFLRWTAERQTSLTQVTSAELHQFLDGRMSGRREGRKDLNSMIRLRYLRLLERVYSHLEIEPNPARLTAFQVHASGASGKDAPKSYLTETEQRAFMQALPEYTLAYPGESPKAWKRRRDRALLAMLVGAGLKVSEAIGLYVENVGAAAADGSVDITVSPGATGGISRWHTTTLRAFAAPEVLVWLQERQAMPIGSKLLFPANLDGKRLNPSTVYLYVKDVLARAGIDVKRKGPRTLRNTFAKRELAAGADPGDVIEYMGLFEARSLDKYQGAERRRATRRSED